MAKAAHQEIRSVCPYCGVGCGIILHVREGKIERVSGDQAHPANRGRLCTKGTHCLPPLSADDRLTRFLFRPDRSEPFVAQEPGDAIRAVARRLQLEIDAHGPDAVALYVSGQMSLESQYLANKLCKGFLRTNQIDSNSRLCMAGAAAGYRLSLGADAPPGSYEDLEHTDCALLVGANMADCHPILFHRLLDARRARGTRLIVVDPRRSATAQAADLHLALRPGTDLALLNGLLHLLAVAGRLDQEFIARHTEGWSEMTSLLAESTPARVADICGIALADLRKAAEWLGGAKEFVTLWTMGINQTTRGVWASNAICHLHLATGCIGRRGSGPFSLTGQPNAMGGRDVGYLSHGLPGQRSVQSAEDRAFCEELWGLAAGTIRPEPGPDAVELFQRMRRGQIRAAWIICTNPAVSLPNRDAVVEALRQVPFVIVQDAFHPTETTALAHALLPGALWAEADGTMVNSERTVTLGQRAVAPPGQAMADWEIIAAVARAMGFSGFEHRSAAEVFAEIQQSAHARTAYDLRGMSYESLRAGPCQWPCAPGATQGKANRYLRDEGRAAVLRFATPSGRARFLPRPWSPRAEERDDPQFPFVLTTGRCAHQWHSMTKTGKVLALNRLDPGPFLLLHPDDAADLAIAEGQAVEVASERGQCVLPARLDESIRRGSCFAPIHWNDAVWPGAAVNPVTSELIDEISRQPELKYCRVRLTAAEARAGAVAPISARQREFVTALVRSETSEPVEAFSAVQRVWLRGAVADLPGRSVAGGFHESEERRGIVAPGE